MGIPWWISSGHGHDLTLETSGSSPALSTDVPSLDENNNRSLGFNGIGGLSYSWPIPEMANSTQLTVKSWVKFEGSLPNRQTIVGAFQTSFETLWWFGTNDTNELMVAIPNQANYPGWNVGWPSYGETVGANLQLGQWYHVAFTYDGSAATNAERLKIYVNGIRIPVVFSGDIPTSLSSAQPVIRIGNEPTFWAPYYGSSVLNGNLDEVKIYTTARNSTDIALDAAGQTLNLPSIQQVVFSASLSSIIIQPDNRQDLVLQIKNQDTQTHTVTSLSVTSDSAPLPRQLLLHPHPSRSEQVKRYR